MPATRRTAIQADTRTDPAPMHQRLGNSQALMQPALGSDDESSNRMTQQRGPRRVPVTTPQEKRDDRSGLRGRLHPGVVLEEPLVDVRVLLPLRRKLVVDEDSLDGAHGLAG